MTAGVLSDALPYIQEHADRTIVIKYGGHAMEDAAASLSFARDVVMLKQVFLRKWALLVLAYGKRYWCHFWCHRTTCYLLCATLHRLRRL